MRREVGEAIAALGCSLLISCAGEPLIEYSADTPPLVLSPAEQASVTDGRARFREIFCGTRGAAEFARFASV
jgi:hypothetical protein